MTAGPSFDSAGQPSGISPATAGQSFEHQPLSLDHPNKHPNVRPASLRLVEILLEFARGMLHKSLTPILNMDQRMWVN